jgi:hypothetical protein
MRALHVTFLLGIIAACSGEPFTASTSSASDPPSINAGSGGNQAVPTQEPVATTGGATSAEPRAGTNATAGQPEPQAGGGGVQAGGDGGGGGEGGEPAAPACPSKVTGGWELGYFPELREATAQESHPFFQVTNRGAATTLNRIVIRYYFTKESDMAETAVCYWVTGDRCSAARLEFRDLPMPMANASRYLEVSFPNASQVTVAAESLEVRVGFKTGSAVLVQTNDYSFDVNAASPSSTAPFPYKRWLQSTLYVDGELVWGTEPCAPNRDVTVP